MTFEVRACKDQEELKEYGKIVSYVFASTEGMEEELNTTQPDWTTCGFVDGRMVATMGTFPFTVRLNGVGVKMGGVTAVGTLPEQRRKGHLRKIMTKGFEEMRERGQNYAILWASMGAIYQRFGYGLASTGVNYTFDPRYVAFESGPEPTGSVTILDKEEAWPIIKQLYVQWATPRNLAIHRAVPLWDADIFRPRKKGEPVYIGVYRNGDGEVRGYIVYNTFEGDHAAGPGPDQTFNVKDFIPLDMDAYRGIWNYIRGHDLVGKVVMYGAIGEDDPAPDLLLEPRMLNRSTRDAIWMRVVDIERAIPQRPYGDRGELTFAIEDAMCPWNQGTWLMETDGKTTDVRRSDRSPDLVLPLNTLASLLAGHRSATHYARAGRLEGKSDKALRIADALFRTEHPPFCPNGF